MLHGWLCLPGLMRGLMSGPSVSLSLPYLILIIPAVVRTKSIRPIPEIVRISGGTGAAAGVLGVVAQGLPQGF